MFSIRRLKFAASMIRQFPLSAELTTSSSSFPLLPLQTVRTLAATSTSTSPWCPTPSTSRHPDNWPTVDPRRHLTTTTSPPQEFEKHIVYKGRGIQIFRILVRLKVFQLSGIAALAVPIAAFIQDGEVSHLQTIIAGSLVVGSGVASTALWYYSRRYIGELSVLKPLVSSNRTAVLSGAHAQPRVRFSVLDFWGRREDNDVKLEDVIPPFEGASPGTLQAAATEPVLPITVAGDRQYVLSLRYGHIVDSPMLQALLTGRDLFYVPNSDTVAR